MATFVNYTSGGINGIIMVCFETNIKIRSRVKYSNGYQSALLLGISKCKIHFMSDGVVVITFLRIGALL